MKCLKCRGTMKQGFTTFVADTDGCCIVIRHVPCLQCDECGEVVFSASVSENIERICKSARRALTEVAVIQYDQAVA